MCTGKFGIFRRKHHCRQCGGVVCNGCSSIKDYVTGYTDKKVKICTDCYKKKIEAAQRLSELKPNMVMSALTLVKPPPKKKWL